MTQDPAEYCRQIETYLCKKNEGHLIRIVGPVFEQVSGWAAQGVPVAIACRGIDRYCERYYAKGPRRRPVRIEFCEADILEEFDNWRRAVGVTAMDGGDAAQEPSRRDTLPAHLDRLIVRLAALRTSERSAAFHERVDAAVREVDTLRAAAKHARGDARTVIIASLRSLDAALLDAARVELDQVKRAALGREAESEIAPFAGRMSPDARAAAIRSALDRLIRDAASLPVIAFEP